MSAMKNVFNDIVVISTMSGRAAILAFVLERFSFLPPSQRRKEDVLDDLDYAFAASRYQQASGAPLLTLR